MEDTKKIRTNADINSQRLECTRPTKIFIELFASLLRLPVWHFIRFPSMRIGGSLFLLPSIRLFFCSFVSSKSDVLLFVLSTILHFILFLKITIYTKGMNWLIFRVISYEKGLVYECIRVYNIQ